MSTQLERTQAWLDRFQGDLAAKEIELLEARAENERLKADNELAANELVEYGKMLAATVETDREIERLRASLDGTAEACQEFKDENQRLKDYIAQLEQRVS